MSSDDRRETLFPALAVPLDRLAILTFWIIFVLALPSNGLITGAGLRGTAWALASVLGVYMLASWAMGRVSGSRMQTARWMAGAMAVAIVYCGFQLLALPSGLAGSLSPPVGEIAESLREAGVEAPARMAISQNPERGWAGWHQMVASLLVFGAASILAARRRSSWWLISTVIAVSMIEGFVGLLQYTLGRVDRGAGIVFNPGHHATLILMGMPLYFAALGHLRRKSPRFQSSLISGTNPLIILWGLGFLALLSWLVSFSRGSLVLGGGVFFGWAILEWGCRFWEGRKAAGGISTRAVALRLLWTSLVVVGIVVFLAMSNVFRGFISRGWSLEEEGGAITRREIWRSTMRGWSESPMFGLGPAGSEFAITRHSAVPMEANPIWSHNDYVQIFAEFGIVGIALTGVAFGWALFQFGRSIASRWRRFDWEERAIARAALTGCLIALAHALTDFHLRIPLIAFCFLVMLALAMGRGPIVLGMNASK